MSDTKTILKDLHKLCRNNGYDECVIDMLKLVEVWEKEGAKMIALVDLAGEILAMKREEK